MENLQKVKFGCPWFSVALFKEEKKKISVAGLQDCLVAHIATRTRRNKCQTKTGVLVTTSEGEPRKMMVVAIVLGDFVETHTTVKGGGF